MSSRPYTYKGRRSRAVSFLNKKKVLCFLFSSPPFVFHFFGTVFHSWFSLYLPTCSGFRVQGFGLFTLGFLCICLPVQGLGFRVSGCSLLVFSVFAYLSMFSRFVHFLSTFSIFSHFFTPHPSRNPPKPSSLLLSLLFTFVVTVVAYLFMFSLVHIFPLFPFLPTFLYFSPHFFHFSLQLPICSCFPLFIFFHFFSIFPHFFFHFCFHCICLLVQTCIYLFPLDFVCFMYVMSLICP